MVQGVGALCGDSAVLGWMRGTVTVTECRWGARHIRDTFYGAVTDWGLVVSCSQIRDGS